LSLQGFTGYNTESAAIVVGVRGTVSHFLIQTKYSKCSGCEVHLGFYNAYKKIGDALLSSVKSLNDKYPNAPIHLTGHSLGGVLTMFAALDIKDKYGRADQIYTYGQPRLGNLAFSNYFESQVP
jgi:predicted lipase